MKLSEVKSFLTTANAVHFQLQNGTMVPEHFHVTEVGLVSKHFIDCGGVVREEKKVNFQLWDANDFEHRLKPQKLLNIIALSEKILGIEDFEVEVEYQTDTIGKYSLSVFGSNLQLVAQQTACLASDACGIPADKMNLNLIELAGAATTCKPGGGCC